MSYAPRSPTPIQTLVIWGLLLLLLFIWWRFRLHFHSFQTERLP